MAAAGAGSGLHAAACLLLCVFCASVAVHATKTVHSEAEQARTLHQLFSELDHNGDGQLDTEELRSSASSLDAQEEGWPHAAAAQASQEALDGPDKGEGISAAELAQHLRALLQAGCRLWQLPYGVNNLPSCSLALLIATLAAPSIAATPATPLCL